MGKLPRVVAAMSSAVMTRARVVLLAHGVSEHSARVCIAHGAQVDPAVGAARVGDIRDPHPVQATLGPTGGRSDPHGPLGAVRRAWPGAGACTRPGRHPFLSIFWVLYTQELLPKSV